VIDAFGCVRCDRFGDKGDDDDMLRMRSTMEGATKLTALGYSLVTVALSI